MKKPIYQLLDDISKIESINERGKALKQEVQATPALGVLLKYAYDPKIEFLLPEGETPYTPSQFDEPGMLYTELRRLYLFVKDGHPTLKQVRRESLWVELLQSVSAKDAIILDGVKNKKLPVPYLTEKFVQKTLPELFK